VRISKELALKRANTLVRCNSRGRAISINQWDDGTPSRFFLMRTADQAIWNFRYDVPDDIAARVERLCEQEPKGDPPSRLPAHYHRYLRLLALHASVENIRAGPVYMFRRDVLTSEFLISIDQNNADLLRGGFEDWLPDVPHRQPFKAVVEDGHAVSLCASVRISDAVHCAGVETLADYRRRGHAVNVVAGWARAVRALGAVPFYSTSWNNLASCGVAGRLRQPLIAVDFSVS